MKPFRTVLEAPPFPFSITRKDPVYLMGSCFTQHIGERLNYWKYRTAANGWGILYNPMSVAKALSVFVGQAFDPSIVSAPGGGYVSLDHHGDFWSEESESLSEDLHRSSQAAGAYLKEARLLVISWGTSMIHRYNQTGQIVGNCHRLPAGQFTEERLSVEDIVNRYRQLFTLLHAWNDRLQIILTVSPIRHLRNGLVKNQRSKAVLLMAAEALTRDIPHCHYFPSYELLLDDLRDYRFYDRDLVHPSQEAVEYIWDAFASSVLEQDPELDRSIEKIRNGLSHRPHRGKTAAHQAFLEHLHNLLLETKEKYDWLDFSQELRMLQEHSGLSLDDST